MLLLFSLFLVLDIFLSANCHLPIRKGYSAPSPSPEVPPSSPGGGEEQFEQKVDHFTESDTRTWKQRYFSDSSFYKEGGPAYLWLGEEGPITADDLGASYWCEHGKTVGAIVFEIEHRFYGTSQPLGDLSLENLRYLTVAQVLEDYVAFIAGMNEKHKLPPDTKWFIFGGSYAGNLAAWMRVKYPDIIHGAVASSAPINVKVDNPEYFGDTVETLASYKKECTDDIAKANQELETKVQTPEGRDEIGQIFKLCTPLTGDKIDTAFFLYNMALDFSDALQTSSNNAEAHAICDKLLEDAANSDVLKRYSNYMNWYNAKVEDVCLYADFKIYISSYMETKSFYADSFASNRQWKYQQCSEMGQGQTVGPDNAAFSKLISSELFEAWCTEVFGPEYNKELTSKGVDSINKTYGGAGLSASRIVFVNGSLDPWNAASITSKDQNPNVEVIFIQGSNHGADLYIADENSPPELVEAQKQLASMVDGWMNEPK